MRTYEFKCASSVSPKDAVGLRQGIADGVIHTGLVVYPGQQSYPLDDTISAISATELLTRDPV